MLGANSRHTAGSQGSARRTAAGPSLAAGASSPRAMPSSALRPPHSVCRLHQPSPAQAARLRPRHLQRLCPARPGAILGLGGASGGLCPGRAPAPRRGTHWQGAASPPQEEEEVEEQHPRGAQRQQQPRAAPHGRSLSPPPLRPCPRPASRRARHRGPGPASFKLQQRPAPAGSR